MESIMDIDLKSAGIGAGVGATLVGLIWLGKKLFTKKVVTESTPKWDQMKTMFDMFKHSTKDNTNNAPCHIACCAFIGKG